MIAIAVLLALLINAILAGAQTQQTSGGTTAPTPATTTTPAAPQKTDYGWTYNANQNTYSDPIGGQTFTGDPSPRRGYYYSQVSKGEAEASGEAPGGYRLFNPRTGQEVTYDAQGNPTSVTQYDKDGETVDAKSGDITDPANDPRLREFRGGGPTTAEAAGAYVKAYNQYKGLSVYTTLIYGQWGQELREQIQQNFCIATGITNCLVSRICGSIYKIEADNIIVGRGPTGQFISSAALMAKVSLPVEIAGMERQQLIYLFGTNVTFIAGQEVNFADPRFDPETLGLIKLRQYQVQYSITNNDRDQRTMTWNLEFRTPAGASRKWFSQNQILEYGQNAKETVFKPSAAEYNEVCLTFDRPLPSGSSNALWAPVPTTTRPSYTRRALCQPFVEYPGGPTPYTGPAAAAPATAGVGGAGI